MQGKEAETTSVSAPVRLSSPHTQLYMFVLIRQDCKNALSVLTERLYLNGAT